MRRLICFCLLMFPFLAYAAVMPEVHEYKLNNGLKLIVREDHRAPIVLSSIWYKVGSSYEQNGRTGISHALEHMMFRGTHLYPAGQLVKIVNQNGGLQNAMTTEDYTMYYQVLPANKLDVSFALEADRMHNLLLTDKDFSKEIQVVMEERRMNFEDNPQSMTWVLLNAAANVNNPDQHPTIGWKSDLQQMTVTDLRQWYHEWYGPNNAALVVVGDVNPAEVYALAEKYFDSVPGITLPIIKHYEHEPYVSTRKITVRLPAELPELLMAYNVPSIMTATESWQPYALTLLATILGEGDSSRLVRELVRQKQSAVDVSVDYDPLRLYDSLFVIGIVPTLKMSRPEENTSKSSPETHGNKTLTREVLAQIKQLQEHLVSNQELERAKAQYLAEYIFDTDSLSNQAMQIGVAEMIGLPWQTALNEASLIKAVTPEQIQKVAKLYLQPNRLTIAKLQPDKSKQSQPLSGESNGQTSVLH